MEGPLSYKLTPDHAGEYLVEFLKDRKLIGDHAVYEGIDLYAEGGRIILFLGERLPPCPICGSSRRIDNGNACAICGEDLQRREDGAE